MIYRRLLSIIACLLLITSCSAQAKTSPPPTSTTVAAPKPHIVIDAGHGGKDLGTHSATLGYQEKDIALRTAKILQKKLQALGYTTTMTRSTDTFIPLPKRASIANNIPNALFVSIHYNFSKNTDAQGIEVYHCTPKATEDPKRLALSQALATQIFDATTTATNAKRRSVKTANFSVLRNTTTPAVLIEGGFLSNPTERSKLRTTRYLSLLADGIAQGIDTYVKEQR